MKQWQRRRTFLRVEIETNEVYHCSRLQRFRKSTVFTMWIAKLLGSGMEKYAAGKLQCQQDTVKFVVKDYAHSLCRARGCDPGNTV